LVVTPPVFRYDAAVEVGAVVTLDGAEGRHAADVRRLAPGEAICLTDGAGLLVTGVVADSRRGSLDVRVETVQTQPRPAPRLVVVQALAKGGRDEDAIEAMTEVGVDEIVGWSASRSIAKWTDRTESRWQATVAAAAKQSRRVWWPTVCGPASTAAVADLIASVSVSLVLHETASDPLATVDVPVDGNVLVVVGPEGGISDEELAVFGAAGARAVRLGASVLRSSTAGVAALSVLSARSRWRS
jgi:16S rRNA (uracil1498-N3)-methyltransferase